jgi:hypothetical protein
MIKVFLIVSTMMLTACAQKVVAPKLPIKARPTLLIAKKIILKPWHWDDNFRHWIKKGKVFDANVKRHSEIDWKPQEAGIKIALDLVRFPNISDHQHSDLLMKVFQFTDPTAFIIAIKSTSGLKRLLTAPQIDPACISVRNFFITAGKHKKITLRRVGGARYLGIVLGYKNLKMEKITRLIPIVTVAKPTKINVKKATPTLLTPQPQPATLALKLSLGANGINHLKIEAY